PLRRSPTTFAPAPFVPWRLRAPAEARLAPRPGGPGDLHAGPGRGRGRGGVQGLHVRARSRAAQHRGVPDEQVAPIPPPVRRVLACEASMNNRLRILVLGALTFSCDNRPGEAPAPAPRPVAFELYRVPLGDSPARGGSAPRVTLVVFSEFQCPFCARV